MRRLQAANLPPSSRVFAHDSQIELADPGAGFYEKVTKVKADVAALLNSPQLVKRHSVTWGLSGIVVFWAHPISMLTCEAVHPIALTKMTSAGRSPI
jgi:hypothetical protein